MQQIILNDKGALVCRMPRPVLEVNSVLVQVKYSMISIGTEISGLRASRASIAQQEVTSAIDKAKNYSKLFKSYVGKAVRNPTKAINRINQIAKNKFIEPSRRNVAPKPQVVSGLTWKKQQAMELQLNGSGIQLVTDESACGYQAITSIFDVLSNHALCVEFKGELKTGKLCVGFLNESMQWIGNQVIEAGKLYESVIFEAKQAQKAYLIITNAEGGSSQLQLDDIQVSLLPPDDTGLAHNELQDQGWNVGYSAVGEIIAVGDNINDLVLGDIVACAGAGKANHAEFICVPRNLVSRVPEGCDLASAASTTIGTIAMQGVRRANPTLGETIVVLGLGLLGQLTMQMLQANGCVVIGMDLDADRVKRAKQNGMEAGCTNPEKLKKIVHDLTMGQGADRVLITAATKSNVVINLAMELSRRKGTVVIIGDVGMDIERPNFYKKEIDLLISSSYGPGRYDREYEEEGKDYPYAYVRWTLNRNMQAYLKLIQSGKIDIKALVDRVVNISNAPAIYQELATAKSNVPLAVIIEYPEENPGAQQHTRNYSTAIALQGARKPHLNKINYALIGAGAFGTCMLVPQMTKIKDLFFLRAVVSRDSIRGGNFARQQGVEIFSSDINKVIENPDIKLLVIATRHSDHAKQTIAGLKAGKHVFVEKPLALTWQELDEVVRTYEELDEKPLFMVDFNRRFSPAMQQLKQTLNGRRSPLIINYRLNGGYIPLDSWLQGKDGGGRNIGEACHMYDCFRFLTGAKVKNIQAAAINPGDLPYFKNDNFTVIITYEDGSVANLIYTALGPKQGLPKERVEVFCDNEAYLLDDYKSLLCCSKNEMLWSGEVDKGHFTELTQLGNAIKKGAESPIPFTEIIETSAVALQIEDILLSK